MCSMSGHACRNYPADGAAHIPSRAVIWSLQMSKLMLSRAVVAPKVLLRSRTATLTCTPLCLSGSLKAVSGCLSPQHRHAETASSLFTRIQKMITSLSLVMPWLTTCSRQQLYQVHWDSDAWLLALAAFKES